MGALLRARAGVGGGPGGPCDMPWTLGAPLPCAGDRLPRAAREGEPLSRELLPERLLRWRRSQAGRLLGQLKVTQNAPDDGALRQLCQHPSLACAPWAREDIYCERPAEQPRPVPPRSALTPPAAAHSCRPCRGCLLLARGRRCGELLLKELAYNLMRRYVRATFPQLQQWRAPWLRRALVLVPGRMVYSGRSWTVRVHERSMLARWLN